MSKVVAFDTSTNTGSVALVRDDRLLAECSVTIKKGHSGFLLPALDQLLSHVGWTTKDLEMIACAVGPGSFAALRIGISTAKGLAFALNIPTVGVNSLEAMARHFGYAEKTIVPILDAKKAEVYAAFFRADGSGHPVRIDQDMVCKPLELTKKIAPGSILVGEGAIKYRAVFEREISDPVLFAPESMCYHKASATAVLAAELFRQGTASQLLIPNYLRQPDAVEPKVSPIVKERK